MISKENLNTLERPSNCPDVYPIQCVRCVLVMNEWDSDAAKTLSQLRCRSEGTLYSFNIKSLNSPWVYLTAYINARKHQTGNLAVRL